MFAQFFILSLRGDVIIYKNFRGDIDHRETAETFFRKVRECRGDPPPIFLEDKITYLHMKRNGLYFFFTTKFNVSPSITMELLNRVIHVLKDYCGVLNEEAVRKNFTLIYELLDEALDFGYPQITTTSALKPHIHNETLLLDEQIIDTTAGIIDNLKTVAMGGQRVASSMSSSRPVTDRSAPKNDIFVDVLEKLQVITNTRGDVLMSHVDGVVTVKSFVAGEPEMRIGFNEDLVLGNKGYKAVYGQPQLDHFMLHDCVNSTEFEGTKTLSFIPPEGEFDLMRYRVTRDSLLMPFRLSAYAEEYPSDYRLELHARLRCELPANSHASNIRVIVPLPKDFVSAQGDLDSLSTTSQQSTEVKDRSMHWLIKMLPGQNEIGLRVRILLASGVSMAEAKKDLAPFHVNFELPMCAVSGLEIHRLLVFDRGQSVNPHRWIRYITSSASYVVRHEIK